MFIKAKVFHVLAALFRAEQGHLSPSSTPSDRALLSGLRKQFGFESVRPDAADDAEDVAAFPETRAASPNRPSIDVLLTRLFATEAYPRLAAEMNLWRAQLNGDLDGEDDWRQAVDLLETNAWHPERDQYEHTDRVVSIHTGRALRA